MTNLAELAGIGVQTSESVDATDLLIDSAVARTAASMTDMGDLYRYTGTKPNHIHAAIPD